MNHKADSGKQMIGSTVPRKILAAEYTKKYTENTTFDTII